MTDVMTCGYYPDDPLRAPARREPYRGQADLLVEQRIRDLELICKAQQQALNYLLVSLTAKHSRDLKEKVWPVMEAAEMIINGD